MKRLPGKLEKSHSKLFNRQFSNLMSGKVIISGGGTGGHIFPAIAIAKELQKSFSDIEVLFVGAKGRMEMEKVPAAGFEIEGLWISGLQRKLSLKNLLIPLKVISSILKARKIIKRFKPDIAVGVGGYASAPLCWVAGKRNIPVLLQEQNSYPGITNKLLARKASKICVAYNHMEAYFPKDKLMLTGNPVRSDIQDVAGKRTDAFKHFKLDPSKTTILVLGGSLGARTINESMKEALPEFKLNNYQVIWQCGKLYSAEFSNFSDSLAGILVTSFIERMDLAYSAADLIVSRAGALSISELCLVGKPTILIPSPTVAEDHQTKNARSLVEKDAAVLIKDSFASQKLAAEVVRIMNSEDLKKSLALNISKLAEPDSAYKIAKEIMDLMKHKS